MADIRQDDDEDEAQQQAQAFLEADGLIGTPLTCSFVEESFGISAQFWSLWAG